MFGKAQPLDSLVFTKNGYKKMGEIEIGEEVVDGKGNITKVTNIFPQGKKPIYKISFSDNTSTLCADNHLWKVKQNNKDYEILTTKELLEQGIKLNNQYKYEIPVVTLNIWQDNNITDDPYIEGKDKIKDYIPKKYLYSSIETRCRLLQGLLDKNKNITQFKTTKEQLSKDFAFLVRSIGGLDTIIKKDKEYQHTIELNTPIKKITNIEYIDEEDCQCIIVESEDHTYLTNDLIVTHNSTVATYSLAYELYRLMCLKNPNRFYLDANETIYLMFFGLNLKLIEKSLWGKFQKAIQMSPWFMQRGTVTGRTNLIYQPNKNIKLDIGSTEEHALSVAVMYCALDEMSFGSNDNADYKQQKMMQIYNQLYLRISSRFSRNGKILGRMYLISSAKSTNAVLESFIRDNEGQPGMHVSRYKQWEVLPANRFSGKWFKLAVGNEMLESRILGVLGKDVTQEQIDEFEKQGYEVIDVPMEMMHRFEMDMNRTLIDTCGISLQSSYKYIPYRVVEPCIGEDKNPFISEIIKTGLKDDRQIKDYFLPEVVPEELYSRKIYIHCDLSKSGDRTGISAVAVLGYKNQERYTDTGDTSTLREMVFKHVFSVALQCPANDELSMIKVKDFLHYLKYDLGWNIVGVSCDGYQSLMLLQSLKLDGFNTAEVSMDIVKKNEDVGYTTFRNVLVEQRIKLLNLKELLHEITSLEKNETTGKVDHPRQCLVGSTRIKSFGLNGTDKTILELLEDSKKGISNYVYTINEKEHLIQIEKIKKVWKTGERDDLYEITIDDDNKVICTGNHPFMLQDFIYKEAKDLTLDDKLASLYPSNSKITEIKKLDDKLPVYDLEIENNHNFALNNGVFVHNSVKIVNGETIKSVGKDEADSLGGAIYNATLSVDINDLDFIDGVTITDSDMTLNQGINSADQYFGYRTNADGTVNMITNDYDKSNNVNEVVKEIQENNPDTKLTKEQIKDMYNELNNDDMFIF